MSRLPTTLALLSVLHLGACASTVDKLGNIGHPPEMAKIENPHTKPEYKPLTWPLPDPEPEPKIYANTLWQPGTRTFFRDFRASRVGDLVRVKVFIDDKAEVDNKTDRSRQSTETLGAPSVFGLENKIFRPLPGTANPGSLLDITGNTDTQGDGQIEREEKIETMVAATITQVLPNGNFVIEGKQEVRVNFEVREISIAGIIRPQDIDSENTVDSSQIAEARIVYGGRGQLTDVQQPRWGNQVIETLAPF